MLRLFISYSHKDIEWCRRLSAHLKGLTPRLLEEVWFDERINAGDDWNQQISGHLEEADIVLLLVSSDFVDSIFCALEVERAIERRKQGVCDVIPVMLRHCNTSGAAYAGLNFYPPVDRPIDSSSWPDKDLAFRTLVDQVEKVARLRLGAGPKHKLLHPRREELALLLHHLCNRGPQDDALRSRIKNLPRARRPFVIVIQGQPQDSLEWFLSRLENVLLQRYLGEKPSRLSPLKWPDYTPGKTAVELFGPRMADCLPVSPFATIKEMNLALKQMSTFSMLPSSMPTRAWQETDKAMFECFLKLWEDWPPLPRGRFLIPVLEVQHPDNPNAASELAKYLDQVDFVSCPAMCGVVLPPMSTVEQHHFRDWLEELPVRAQLSSPERAIATLNTFMHVFPSRMHPLAEVHLPRFLERL